MLTHAAATDVVLKRHQMYPSPAERAEKPLPVTFTNVPPPIGPWLGSTARTATGCRYSKCTPDELTSCAFVLTSKDTYPDETGTGDEHSSWPGASRRAGTNRFSANRQRVDAVSMKPVPYSVISVPPERRPSTGWILRIVSGCTYLNGTDPTCCPSSHTTCTSTIIVFCTAGVLQLT